MSDFKKQVLDFKTTVFGSPVNPRSLGIYILSNVIPNMYRQGDIGFAWGWKAKDVIVYNQNEYDTETTMYRSKFNLVKVDGDTTWFYDFTIGGKKHRAIITTEIWYKEDEHFNTSPIACLFNQFMAAGLHISKVRFEDLA
jgi:hypothetical protein